ncbi:MULTISPECIES: magnesium/cobalt transporter CorA [Fusobacterium]|uniref:magnesium/cobalt transporter CorA n=1 Tax=Fusobacterium TaxID=848 RepID=UPI001F4F7DDF|nr:MULTISPECIES: magnesium/cobalt transporter CorA [Fusobacterium]MCI7223802.1 magnesium/cobalt transporter CorA [Fusobacterium sp.]MDD7391901.1 magnesium/cobalt transporter CorA [Fusobacteriaceae bacterium]MDD7409656.1 magnesium/cobalt transporter CorA [Fusobacteriaceae bacterium]MDY5713371.1 magnesium/cobalt transporter CorA [Fusobacterium gastrosuis]
MAEFTSLKNRKLGLPPGSVIYTGEPDNEVVNISVIYYQKNFYKKETFTENDTINFNLDFDGDIWINIDGIHNTDLIKKIGVMFNIDNLSLEDIVNPEQRVKIDDRGTYIQIVLKMLSLELLTKEINYEQISIILKDNILITFQETPFDIFDDIRHRIESPKTRFGTHDSSYLAYMLIDTIVDNYLLILDEVELEIDEMETKIIHEPSQEDLHNIISFKQNISLLKRFISPIRELVAKLQTRNMLHYFPEEMKYYLSDLSDHSIIAFDTVEMLNNRTTELIQLYHSTLSNTMNEVMKILAIISTIFMPLTFISGLYGMNFHYMPELEWRYGYFFVIGTMITLVVCMIIYFKKKKWI